VQACQWQIWRKRCFEWGEDHVSEDAPGEESVFEEVCLERRDVPELTFHAPDPSVAREGHDQRREGDE